MPTLRTSKVSINTESSGQHGEFCYYVSSHACFDGFARTAEDYRHYAQKKSNAHYRMSERAAASGRRFGIPVTVATTIVGTSIFATLSSPEHNLVLQIGTGLLSLGAAVLSALHTFFNFSEVAAQHKMAAAEYERVRHELDAFLLDKSQGLSTADQTKTAIQELHVISKHLDEIAKKAPTIPDRVYDAAQTRVATRPIVAAMQKRDSQIEGELTNRDV